MSLPPNVQKAVSYVQHYVQPDLSDDEHEQVGALLEYVKKMNDVNEVLVEAIAEISQIRPFKEGQKWCKDRAKLAEKDVQDIILKCYRD